MKSLSFEPELNQRPKDTCHWQPTVLRSTNWAIEGSRQPPIPKSYRDTGNSHLSYSMYSICSFNAVTFTTNLIKTEAGHLMYHRTWESFYICPHNHRLEVFGEHLHRTVTNTCCHVTYGPMLTTLNEPQDVDKLFHNEQIKQLNPHFWRRSFRLRVLGGRSGIGNRLVWPQMTSQIAGIDILHILAK